jgi:hypothetical protein
MEENAIPYTAFATPDAFYEFKRMPFGLCNAVATFQRLMTRAVADVKNLYGNLVLIYGDVILIATRTIDEHLERLDEVCGVLRYAGIKLKAKKCDIMNHQAKFLGRIVTKEGITPNPEDADKIQTWEAPRNRKEDESILGLACYYREYIEGFAEIAAPLNYLKKKGVEYKWGEEQEKAFTKIKEALSTYPVLALPEDDGDYVLDTDAGANAIGGILHQWQDTPKGRKLRVISYGSRALRPAERNYSAPKAEMLAAITFIEKYQCFLSNKKFVLRCDNQALSWLKTYRMSTPMVARWIIRLDGFHFEIEHRLRTQHMNADALTKRPNEMIMAENTAREVPEMFHFMELDQYQDLPYLEDHRAVAEGVELQTRVTQYEEGIRVQTTLASTIIDEEHATSMVKRVLVREPQEPPDYDSMKEVEKAYTFSGLPSEEAIHIYDLPPQPQEDVVITPRTILQNSTLRDEIEAETHVRTISPGETSVEPQVEIFQDLCDSMSAIVDESEKRHPPRQIDSRPRRTPNTNRPQFTLKAPPPVISRKKRKEIEKAKREGTYVPEEIEPISEEDEDDTLYDLGNWDSDHPLWHLRNGGQSDSDTDDDTPMIEIVPEVPYQEAIMKLLKFMQFPQPDAQRMKGPEAVDVINNSTKVMESKPVPRPQRPPRRYPNIMPKSELANTDENPTDITCRVATVPSQEGFPRDTQVVMQYPPADTAGTETDSENITKLQEIPEAISSMKTRDQDDESTHAQACADDQDDLQDVEMESVAHSNCADLHEIEVESEEAEQGVQWLEARNHNWNGSLTFLDLPLFHTAPNPFVIDVAADMKWNYHPILKVLRKDYPANFEETLMGHRKSPGTILETTTIEGQLIIFLITRLTSLHPSTLNYLQKALTQLTTYLKDRPEIHTLNLPRLTFNIPWADVRPLLHQLIQDVNRPLQLTVCWPRMPQKPFILHQATSPGQK